jgi:uncharacterized membrane protein YfcA
MDNILKQVLFYLVILFSNIIQCITGFAGTVLAMPFSIILVGYDIAKPILNILAILVSIGVVIFNYKSINFQEFFKISAVMIIGMIIGFVILHYISVNKNLLYFILAGIVLFFTLIGIYENFIRKEKKVIVTSSDENTLSVIKRSETIYHKILMHFILIAAGVVHGMFVCGGPLLVLYASRKLKDRDEFRSTLSLSWIVLNTIILIMDIANGFFNLEVLPNMMITLGISSAILIIAILIGNKIAKSLSRKPFMILTYILMAISAVSLILSACGVI